MLISYFSYILPLVQALALFDVKVLKLSKLTALQNTHWNYLKSQVTKLNEQGGSIFQILSI